MNPDQNPCGLFVQGQGMGEGEMNAFCDHAERANYSSIVVMDNYGLCQRLADRLPNCDVGYRAYSFQPEPSGDNKAVIRDYFRKQPQDKRIRQSINCENGFSPERVKMAVDQIEAAEEDGWKLVVGNVGPGTVKCGQLKGDGTREVNEWLTVGEPLLRKLAECPNQAVGYHDYTSVFAWIVANGTYMFQAHDKPPVVDWNLAQWHIGRNLQGINSACDELGIVTPLQIVTEVFVDQMNDIQNNPANPYHGINSRGWRNLIDDWEQRYYPGKSAEDTLADQFEWIWNNVYGKFGRGKVLGLNFFTWLSSTLANGQWKPDNVANAPIFQRRMEAYRPGVEQPPIDPPVDPPVEEPKPEHPIVIPPEPEPQPPQYSVQLTPEQEARVLANQDSIETAAQETRAIIESGKTRRLQPPMPKPVDANQPHRVKLKFTGTSRKLMAGPGGNYKQLGTIKNGETILMWQPTVASTTDESRWRWIENSSAGDGWLCIESIGFDTPGRSPEVESASAPMRKERRLEIVVTATDEEWAQMAVLTQIAVQAFSEFAGLSEQVKAFLPRIVIYDMSKEAQT